MTCAAPRRCESRDESLSMRDVQTVLGHARLSTTADVYLVEDEAQVIRRVQRHLVERQHRAGRSAPPVAVGYDAGDLSVLFGGAPQYHDDRCRQDPPHPQPLRRR
jgi:hypothetical protein